MDILRKQQAVGNTSLVPGLYIEVLWDIENIKKEGRRDGERIVTSVWWRAEVLLTESINGRCRAQLRYDGRDGFASQVGQVWVFPRHVRLVDDEDTQLRWRFYECSGDVTYDIPDEEGLATDRGVAVFSSDSELTSVRSLHERVAGLTQKYEELQRLVIAQTALFSRIIGSGSTTDRTCAKVFTILRQKLALLMQRPVPPTKRRREDDDQSSFFETNCAGRVAADVDCDLDTFQAITRIANSKTLTVCRPHFMQTQYPPEDLEEAEIIFRSLGDIAKVVGVTSLSDLMTMAFRERGVPGGVEGSSAKKNSDVAIRVIGTCVLNNGDDHSPTAILVCQSINERSLSDNITAFIRDSREFDFATRTYTHPLVLQQSTGFSLLRKVFNLPFSDMTDKNQRRAALDLCKDVRGFALRWNAITAPNTRT